MTALPAFDPDATCSKCGGDSVATLFVGAGSQVRFDYATQQKVEWRHLRVEADFIDRRCHRCGYRWQEAAVVTPAQATEPKLDLTPRELAVRELVSTPKRKRAKKERVRASA